MENEPVSFYQIDFLARSIARKFKGDKITHVIGLARGGLIPATIISYQLNVPLLSYAITSYEGTTKTDEFKINQFVHFSDLKSLKEADPHVLVVDDICDTGDTMHYIRKQITLAGINSKLATLFTNDTWIEFPWE